MKLFWIGLHRDPVDHRFPRVHQDVLEQTVAYRVPAEVADELLAFNGSLVIRRTLGELAIRGRDEPWNTLMLNLANDVALERMTVPEARRTAAGWCTRWASRSRRCPWPRACASRPAAG